MSHRRFVSPPGVGPLTKTTGCPRVADLIQYALGLASPIEKQRIDEHLEQSGCDGCRRWIDNAARHRPPSAMKVKSGSGPALDRPRNLPAPPPPSNDATPLPENAKWQRSAFAELERRLRDLEQ